MLDEGVRALAKGRNFAALTTLLPGGQPMTHVMWVDCDDEHVVINTETHRQKAKNIRRDPRVSVCVMSEDFWNWIQVDGTATVVSLPEAMEPLVEYYRAVAGEHPDWDDYRRAMEDQRRVLLRIDIERAGPDRRP